MAIKRRVKTGKQTVRERMIFGALAPKKKRLRGIGAALLKIVLVLKKEIYLPLPDNKIGRFLNKRRRFWPSYFRNSFAELKEVVWPSRKESIKLTMAVFGFAVFFGLLVAALDLVLDKIFKKVLL